jgi:hypothetical protein
MLTNLLFVPLLYAAMDLSAALIFLSVAIAQLVINMKILERNLLPKASVLAGKF